MKKIIYHNLCKLSYIIYNIYTLLWNIKWNERIRWKRKKEKVYIELKENTGKNKQRKEKAESEKRKSRGTYLLLTNARKDEVEAFLNLFTDWRWRGNVISGRVKASLVGSIMDGDQLPFWTRIWETSLLNQRFSLFLAFAYFLDVTTLLGDNIVSRFITMNKLFTSDFKLHSSELYFNMYAHRNCH